MCLWQLVCGVCVRFVSYCDPALQEAIRLCCFLSLRAIDRSHVLLDPVTHWPCLAPALSFSLLAPISPQFRWTLAFPPPSTAHHSIIHDTASHQHPTGLKHWSRFFSSFILCQVHVIIISSLHLLFSVFSVLPSCSCACGFRCRTDCKVCVVCVL